MPWDLFCRVVDNFGDIGVCWRLAAQLAESGQPVRLWVDDASALRWLAPRHHATHPLVSVLDWQQASVGGPWPEPGEVVIEAFACDPPPAFVARMAARKAQGLSQPLWINLEYLSAERHVERSHLLPSPQISGPGAGLRKHFFFPGFSPASGGLLREPGLLRRHQEFDRIAWLSAQGIKLRADEQVVSLFCYPSEAATRLIDKLAQQPDRPSLLLAAGGAASSLVGEHLGSAMQSGNLRAITLPWLSQRDFDHLLWSCDLNWVRGEDSAVRAQWAGQAFIWQLYPQSDGADEAKAKAFLERFFDSAGVPVDASLSTELTQLWQICNGWAGSSADLPDIVNKRAEWAALCLGWRRYLADQSDLLTRLRRFLAEAS